MRRAQAGDRAAFDRLAHRYRAALRALAFLRTGDREEAQDLAQETLARAWQNLATLHDPAAFLPWLKAIAANACNSWHRRARPWTDSRVGEADYRQAAGSGTLPLETVLAREKQRELRRALAALPEANRIALMMHVWDDASYEDIALFTRVEVTTVEGRIYRAKKQLRRLLYDGGAELFGEPLRRWQAQRDHLQTRRKEKLMAKTSRSAEAQALAQPLALTLFSQQFSALIDCGVSLVRSLLALESAPPPYGEAAQQMRREIEEGDTLWQAMSRRPALFSPLHIGLVRAGEVGGVLEETLERAAHLMTWEWQLARRRLGQEEALFFLLSFDKPLDEGPALSSYQQTMSRLLFCETLGLLLCSGVPILPAFDLIAEMLPPPHKVAMLAARAAIKEGDRLGPVLESVGLLPPFVFELIAIGETTGSLDRTLHRAAEVFERELECLFW